GCAEVGEAQAEEEPRRRPAPLERDRGAAKRRRQRCPLRDEERPQGQPLEAGLAQLAPHVLQAVLPRVEIEDELLRRVEPRTLEERTAVAGVVDRAETERRRD